MPVLLLLAAAAILGGVVVVAMGWGGELGPAFRDQPPRAPVLRTPEDVAALRPAIGLFGYQLQAVRDALWQIARVLAERDAELAELRAQVARLQGPQPPAPSAEPAWLRGSEPPSPSGAEPKPSA